MSYDTAGTRRNHTFQRGDESRELLWHVFEMRKQSRHGAVQFGKAGPLFMSLCESASLPMIIVLKSR